MRSLHEPTSPMVFILSAATLGLSLIGIVLFAISLRP